MSPADRGASGLTVVVSRKRVKRVMPSLYVMHTTYIRTLHTTLCMRVTIVRETRNQNPNPCGVSTVPHSFYSRVRSRPCAVRTRNEIGTQMKVFVLGLSAFLSVSLFCVCARFDSVCESVPPYVYFSFFIVDNSVV